MRERGDESIDERAARARDDVVTAGPSVSVVVPVRDGAAFLAEALASVLAQEPLPDEVIVVDDGSADDSAGIAERAGPLVRVVRQAALGPAAARNRGVREARGEWIAFLDADDRWLAGKQRVQAAAVRAAPDADMVFGHVRQFFSPEWGREGAPRPEVLRGVIPTAAWVRRSAFLATGGFSEEWRTAEWVEWMVRAERAGMRSVTVPDIVAERRIHARNGEAKMGPGRLEYVRVARAAMAARRAGGARVAGAAAESPGSADSVAGGGIAP